MDRKLPSAQTALSMVPSVTPSSLQPSTKATQIQAVKYASRLRTPEEPSSTTHSPEMVTVPIQPPQLQRNEFKSTKSIVVWASSCSLSFRCTGRTSPGICRGSCRYQVRGSAYQRPMYGAAVLSARSATGARLVCLELGQRLSLPSSAPG
jgi:hypothetical protein